MSAESPVDRSPLWQHTDEDGDRAYLRDDDGGWALAIPQRIGDHADRCGRLVYLDRAALLNLYHVIGDELAVSS